MNFHLELVNDPRIAGAYFAFHRAQYKGVRELIAEGFGGQFICQMNKVFVFFSTKKLTHLYLTDFT